MILSPDELLELTGKKQHRAQKRVLTALGIESRQRPDTSLVVSRTAVEEMLGVGKSAKVRTIEPNWAACA